MDSLWNELFQHFRLTQNLPNHIHINFQYDYYAQQPIDQSITGPDNIELKKKCNKIPIFSITKFK